MKQKSKIINLIPSDLKNIYGGGHWVKECRVVNGELIIVNVYVN